MPIGRSRRISWMKSQARGCRRLKDCSSCVYMGPPWESLGLAGLGAHRLPVLRQEDLRHQHADLAALEARAAGPEPGSRHLGGQPVRRIMADLEGAAPERLVAEQQMAQRAAAQVLQIQLQGLQRLAAHHAAGEHPGLAAASAQVHLAHPADGTRRQAQARAFIVAQRLPFLQQRTHGKVAAGQRGQAQGQRAGLGQPVPHAIVRRGGRGREGQPAGKIGHDEIGSKETKGWQSITGQHPTKGRDQRPWRAGALALGCPLLQSSEADDEDLAMRRMWPDLRRSRGLARRGHRARHALGRGARRLGLPGLRCRQERFRDDGSGLMDRQAPVVIVGTGLAGYGLAREFRKLDTQTPLLLISADDGRSYSKPMLSTAFAKGQDADALVMAEAGAMAEQLNAEIRTHSRVTAIDAQTRRLWLGNETIDYRDLVLALGAECVRVPVDGDATERILSINDLEDSARFRAALAGRQRVLILGAGLIGCEFANDLRLGGFEVDLVGLAEQPMPDLLPAQLGDALSDALRELGVNLYLGRTLASLNHKIG